MAGPALIIEIDRDSVKAGAFNARGEPQAYAAEPLGLKGDAGGALSAALSAVREKLSYEKAFDEVYASVHPSFLSIRVVDVPFDDRDKINEVLPLELSGMLSRDVGEALVDSVPLGGGKALAVAIDKKFLKEWLERLKGHGIDPMWFGSAFFSVPALLDELYGAAVTRAFVSKDSICVSKDGRPLFFNFFSGYEGLGLSLAYIEAEGINVDEVYYTGSGAGLIARFPRAAVAGLTLPGEYPPEGFSIFALARRLNKDFQKEALNFRKGEFEYTRGKRVFRKRLMTASALAFALMAVLLGDLYLRHLSLQREYSSYRDALRGAYMELFPAEKGGADEVYQLMIKIKGMDSEAELLSGMGVLEAMNAIAKASSQEPGMRIRLHELHMGEGRIRAVGEAASFEAASAFKDLLSKGGAFKEALLSDVKAKSAGGEAGAAFSLSITLK